MYRDHYSECPVCSGRLEQARSVWRCNGCNGCWVEERILVDMVLRMRDGLGPTVLEFAPCATAEAVRACPSCRDAMAQVTLEGVALDRCDKHGIWFDESELQVTLEAAGLDRPREEYWAGDLRPPEDNFWSMFWTKLG